MKASRSGNVIVSVQRRILRWFGANGRDLPWRRTRDPWRILVSEVMLQQTQVDRVAPKYAEFVARWPTAGAMALAPLADVLTAWSGLGYNRRAANLWNAARAIVERHGGRVPDDVAALEALPGIGRYTARAVASFAFNADTALWDTNVRRIVLRVFRGGEFALRLPTASAFEALLDRLVPPGRSADWHGALMDLGSAVCRSKDPRCAECPVVVLCAAAPKFRRGAVPKAGFGRRQAAFAGSRRQARGAIMRALAEAGRPLLLADVVRASGRADAEARRIVGALEDDGLVVRDGRHVSLPGRPAR